MSFGPNQVGELIVGTTYSAQTTVPTFIATAADKDVKVLSKDGSAPAVGKPFAILQKTAGDSSKGLNYEFSDKIDPQYVEKVTLKEYTPEVGKAVKVDGFATAGVAAAKRTYVVEIRVENQLSPENFELISGYYVTGEALGSDTATTIRDGVLASLNKNLLRRGNSEFTAATDTTGILVTEKIQNNVPGKVDGRKLLFSVVGKVFENVASGYNSNLGVLTSTQTVSPDYGQGTGKFATNYEWFAKGYKYDADRWGGYPADFMERAPFYTKKSGLYNVVQIKYYSPRNETIQERQYKVLTILMEKTANTKPLNAATNSLLADLRTVIGTAKIPADLAIV